MISHTFILKFICSLAVVWIFAGHCVADEFSDQDQNKDGVLSGKEAVGLISLDADGDGEISRREFDAAVNAQSERASAMVASIFKERDGNEDGRLSGSEASGLEAFDQNGDGRIVQSELLGGYTLRDPSMHQLSFNEVRKIALDRFSKLDANSDGRLSGTEAHGSTHFDQNADGRISEDEFALGMILSVKPASVKPEGNRPNGTLPKATLPKATPPKPSKPNTDLTIPSDFVLEDVLEVMNAPAKVPALMHSFDPRVKKLMDPCILEYAFQHAQRSHGKFQMPDKKAAKTEKGVFSFNGIIPSEKGKLTLNLKAVDGLITEILFDSNEMKQLDKALLSDLFRDEYQDRFAKVYGTTVEKAVSTIVAGNDDEALQMIHPSVIEQIGKAPFEKLSRNLRAKINKIDKLELESFAADQTEKGIVKFTVTYLVQCEANSVLFSGMFQRVGLRAVMTGFAVEHSYSLLETTPAAPGTVQTPPPSSPKMIDPKSSDGWIETVSLRDGVKFRMPGNPSRTETKEVNGTEAIFLYEHPNSKMTFSLSVVPVKFDTTTASDKFFENVKNSLLKKGGELMAEATENNAAGFPIQVLGIKTQKGAEGNLYILDRSNVYLAGWKGPSADKEGLDMARQFFESVVLIDAGGAPRSFKAAEDDLQPAPVAPPAPPAPAAPPAPVLPLAPIQ